MSSSFGAHCLWPLTSHIMIPDKVPTQCSELGVSRTISVASSSWRCHSKCHNSPIRVYNKWIQVWRSTPHLIMAVDFLEVARPTNENHTKDDKITMATTICTYSMQTIRCCGVVSGRTTQILLLSWSSLPPYVLLWPIIMSKVYCTS